MPDRPIDIVYRNARPGGGEAVDMCVTGGRFSAFVAPGTPVPDGTTAVDLAGGLVLPGFVDGHMHLDKTLLGDVWIDNDSSAAIPDRIRHELQVEDAARLPLATRAGNLIELAITKGSTRLRSHVDVDPRCGLDRLRTMLAVRESHAGAIDIQIVAFPQLGVLTRPGTAELLTEALRSGADVLGGIDPAGADGDVAGQLDLLFGMAERHGVGIDIHLHDQGSLGIHQLEQIARRTTAHAMQGKVVASHAHSLGTVETAVALRTGEALAEAGVAVFSYGPGNVPIPPIKGLRDVGVTVFLGNDNIRDPWTPFGNADMLERAMLVAYRSGFRADADLRLACDLATYAGATATGAEGYGVGVGDRADFTVVDAASVPEAVVTRPVRDLVVKSGRVVARAGRYLGAGSGR